MRTRTLACNQHHAYVPAEQQPVYRGGEPNTYTVRSSVSVHQTSASTPAGILESVEKSPVPVLRDAHSCCMHQPPPGLYLCCWRVCLQHLW